VASWVGNNIIPPIVKSYTSLDPEAEHTWDSVTHLELRFPLVPRLDCALSTLDTLWGRLLKMHYKLFHEVFLGWVK